MKDMNLTEKDVEAGVTVKKATKLNSDDTDGGLGLGSAFQDFGTYNGKTIG